MKQFFTSLFRQVIDLKKSVLLIVFSILLSYSIYLWCSEDFIIRVGLENNLFELATVAFFLTASVFFFRAFLKTKSIFLLLLSLMMFIGGGEELSWGQQLFQFETPENIKKDNIQGEFNIHNLDIFNGGDENHVKKQGLERLLEINFMFRIFCIGFGILLPLAVFFFSPFKKLATKIKLPVPPLAIGLFFIINWVSFRVTLNSLPEGKPDEPNATYLIVNHPTADSNVNKAKDAIIQQQIVSILNDSSNTKRTSIVKQFEVIRKSPTETHFEIKYLPLEKRQGVKSSDFFRQLSALPTKFADLKWNVNKDRDYYCTTTESFECLSALILMLISIFFFNRREILFKKQD